MVAPNRIAFAYARDGVFPFSATMSKLNSVTKTPLNALWVRPFFASKEHQRTDLTFCDQFNVAFQTALLCLSKRSGKESRIDLSSFEPYSIRWSPGSTLR